VQTSRVHNSLPWHPIDKDFGARCAQGYRQPLQKPIREAELAQDFEEKTPREGIKSTRDVKFEEHEPPYWPL
jgi:hypothetical protein